MRRPRGRIFRFVRKWLFRLSILVVVGIVVFFFRDQLMPYVAKPLILDGRLNRCDYLVLLGADQTIEEVLDRLKEEEAGKVVLVSRNPGRLTQDGILQPQVVVLREKLIEQGVSEDEIVEIDKEARTDWDVVRNLTAFATENPAATYLLLCDRFQSRRFSKILKSVSEDPTEGQFQIRAWPDRDYDESNWWKSKKGITHCFQSWVRLLYTYLHGEDSGEWATRTKEELAAVVEIRGNAPE